MQHNLADLPVDMRGALCAFLELAARRDRDVPAMKVRLTAGISRPETFGGAPERTITLRAEVEGGYTDEDLLVVIGIGRRFGARASVQNSAVELIFDGSAVPQQDVQTRAVRVEHAGQSILVDVHHDDGGEKSIGNLAREAAQRMEVTLEAGSATSLHGNLAGSDHCRILDGAPSATLLQPGGVYRLVIAPPWSPEGE